jgi:hypothetical protein
VLLFAGAYAQTYLYGTVGIGRSEVKKFKLHYGGLANTFIPNLYHVYELGISHNLTSKFSVRASGGFSAYSCTVGLPEGYVPSSNDYYDKLNKFNYLSFPVGVRYNPKWGLNIEAGIVNNYFLKHTYQDVQFFYNIKKYTAIPYWGFSYTFFDRLEVGFIDHLYLSNFATYTNWYEQTNGIEPSVFFKYDVWNVYVSYKIRLSKHNE